MGVVYSLDSLRILRKYRPDAAESGILMLLSRG
jgi:hypothetical protein